MTERKANLSPAAFTDSLSGWSLDQVVGYMRKGKDSDIEPCRIHSRTSIHSLSELLDHLADMFHTSRGRLSCWVTYHGAAISREDPVVACIKAAQSRLRGDCLRTDDMDTLDLMGALTPYSPKIMKDHDIFLAVYNQWVMSEFEQLATSCAVPRWQVVQIYMVKSILTLPVESYGYSSSRLASEIERWDSWLGLRLGSLERLSSVHLGKK